MKCTYLLIDLGCIVVPFIFSFHKKYPFYKQWRSFIIANLLTAIFFVIWDMIFTSCGVWGFNKRYLIGLDIFNLPLEEILFFICIPYACAFTYFALESLFPNLNKVKKIDYIVYFITALALSFTVLGYGKLYTFLTGLFTFIFLTICLLYKLNLRLEILAYLAIMPFFFISNGILTGSFIEESIVWYNDSQNLGIRLFTIPVEDTMYGFLLILMTIVLMNKFKNRSQSYRT